MPVSTWHFLFKIQVQSNHTNQLFIYDLSTSKWFFFLKIQMGKNFGSVNTTSLFLCCISMLSKWPPLLNISLKKILHSGDDPDHSQNITSSSLSHLGEFLKMTENQPTIFELCCWQTESQQAAQTCKRMPPKT